MAMASYFSIAFELIEQNGPISYDLYVNSSGHESKEKYVRVFPMGENISESDIEAFKKKYHRLYIPEIQRSFYLQSLVKRSDLQDVAKTEILKDTAIEYLGNIFDENREFTTEVLNETIQGCKDSVESLVNVVKDYNIQGIQNLIGSLSYHDFYTDDHSINVSMYCIGIYKTIRPHATSDELTLAGLGGMLHDLGKIKIPTSVINHPGKLTDEMFQMIQKHPENGKLLLEDDQCDCEGVDIDIIKRVVYEHHENFNGTGYPNKIKGEDIHLMARITAIADFFDAITTKRSYHEVLSVEEAMHVMAKSKGKKIDPQIFDAFVANAKTLLKEGRMNFQLPDDFDPCRPHEGLPLEKVENKKAPAPGFGKVKVYERLKPKKKKAS